MTSSAWAPQEGPQAEAIAATWCEELFFGGARGGGKSDYLLGDFLQDVQTYGEHWRGILFRKSHPELQEIIERGKQLFLPTGAIWYEQKREFRWPNGAFLRMRHIDSDGDADLYQGHQYCVAVGTPVLMADGSWRTIESIRPGDLVATLEGPRAVTDCVAPYPAECVEVVTDFGAQVHPVWHPILTDDGWISSSDERAACATARLATVCRACGKLSKVSGGSYLAHEKRPSWMCCDPLLACEPSQLTPGHTASPSACGGRSHDPLDSQTPLDSPVGCQSHYCSCGEQPRLDEESDQAQPPSLADAALPSPPRCIVDAQGNTQGYSPDDAGQYVHPYTAQARPSIVGTVCVAYAERLVGSRLVSDITVDGANHYITAGGFVNKNTWIGWDELPIWKSLYAYFKLKACLRYAAADVPTKRIRSAGNPGGPGHQAVKAYFIDHAVMGYEPRKDANTGHRVMFIPSRVQDNKILLTNDPGYIGRLKGVGSPELVRAWLEGDWSVVTGAYFPEFGLRHIVQPIALPGHWLRFRSMDWGSAKPFSVGWWAVSDGTIPQFPAGALIRYREWYGSSEPNVGLKMTAAEVAKGIRTREIEAVAYSVGDPAMFQEDGGPSIAEEFNKQGVYLQPADNSRIAGWNELRARLKGVEDKPLIYVFSTCRDTIRTLPAIQHDDKRPEDVDSDGEDHAPDEIRYACMSRPYFRKQEAKKKERQGLTLNQLWADHQRSLDY